MNDNSSRGKAPAFQFYASDFFASTLEMTNEEVGVYIRLLCHQWINGGLNGDINKLDNVVKNLINVWPSISHKFEMCDDGKLRNPRLEDVRQKQIEYREKQSIAGRIGASKRWHNNPNDENIALRSSSSSSKDQNTRPFHKPTVDEVKTYCVQRSNRIDPQGFIDYYQAQGWVLSNGRKMKDWKAAVRNWESRDKQKQQDDAPTLKKGDYL